MFAARRLFFTRCFSTNRIHDLIVIGGGSGGLATAKEAARYGADVALFDFVHPSPQNTTWGVGGTCVNVGCVPKKLMHHAGMLGHILHKEIETWGWNIKKETLPQKIQWDVIRPLIQNYIKRLNFIYRTDLRSNKIKYINAHAQLISPNAVKYKDPQSPEEIVIEAKNIVVATGTRPYLSGNKYCITSDDIFSLHRPPNRTLIIGGSYVALEIAGFLATLGFPVTLAIRSTPLREFDRQCVALVMDELANVGVEILLGVSITNVAPPHGNLINPLTPLKVTFTTNVEREFDTVVLGIGRRPLANLNLKDIGCQLDANNFLMVNDHEQTTVPNIYGIGDVTGKVPLTPVAVKAGMLLARRLYGRSTTLMNYSNIPTAIFTPTEYACIGMSQEKAEAVHGKDNVEIYLQEFTSLETAAINGHQRCLAKVTCLKQHPQKILGIHFVGPQAAEIVQGYALAVTAQLNKADLDTVVGIHPSNAEVLTQLDITLRSGENFKMTGGCGGGRCG